MWIDFVNKRTKIMIYYNAENANKFINTITEEARILGVDLVSRDLDRYNVYYTDRYKDIDNLIKAIREDMRLWFSGDNLNKKEMCVSIGNEPWMGESVRIQTRRKR